MKYKLPFFIKTSSPDRAFSDRETGIAVHGNQITEVKGTIGKLTMRFLRAGGLVVVSDKEVALAKKQGRVYDGDVFTRKTKIVMVAAEKGSRAEQDGHLVPTEVPLTEEDKRNQLIADGKFKPTEDEDDDEEDGDEGEDDGEDEDEDTESREDGAGAGGPSLADVLKGTDDAAAKKVVGKKTTK